nr:ribonuclease H-like domain-containing protein [Tanacetum cinerariifolium]
MSAMGELNFFLGLQVLQKEDGIFLSQDKYVGDIFKKFGYSEVRSSNTNMDKEDPWGKDGTGKDTIVATSTTEAEYVAAASCYGQVPWCKLFPLLRKLSTVSVFLGFGLTFAGISKYWGVLRILMISLSLIPL